MRQLEPFRELEELQDRIGQPMQTVWSGLPVDDAPRPWAPFVDVEEAEDAWIVEAELPGVDRRDVDVELHDSELVISGEIKEKEREGILRRRTRRTGMFEYRVALPPEVDADRVDAKLADGVLTVRVPKSERARPRRVEVQSAAA